MIILTTGPGALCALMSDRLSSSPASRHARPAGSPRPAPGVANDAAPRASRTPER
jgi:hypothetical protein